MFFSSDLILLNLSGSTSLTDETVHHVIEKAQKLAHFGIPSKKTISVRTVNELLKPDHVKTVLMPVNSSTRGIDKKSQKKMVQRKYFAELCWKTMKSICLNREIGEESESEEHEQKEAEEENDDEEA